MSDLFGRILRIAAEDARADQRMRVDVGVAEELVAIGNDAAQRTGLEARQRRARRVDFVGKHPQVARGQPAVFAALEAQLGQLRWCR